MTDDEIAIALADVLRKALAPIEQRVATLERGLAALVRHVTAPGAEMIVTATVQND